MIAYILLPCMTNDEMFFKKTEILAVSWKNIERIFSKCHLLVHMFYFEKTTDLLIGMIIS